jgi:heat shock protein HtpX
MAKRIILLGLVNVLVVTTVTFLLGLFHVQRYFPNGGLGTLAIFAAIWGFGGAFFMLAISGWLAKTRFGMHMISSDTGDPELSQLVRTVHKLARDAGLTTMPKVGIYDSAEINAFATGPTRSRAVVAVSSGLYRSMPNAQAMAVLGHEITHVANGDMVTMTLLQGVINAFVIFVAEIVAIIISQTLRSRDDDRGGDNWFVQNMIFQVIQIPLSLLGLIVVYWFSRQREFRADAGGAKLAGRDNMIHALETLEQLTEPSRGAGAGGQAFQSLKINNPSAGFARLFMSHPPMEERIAALEKLRVN